MVKKLRMTALVLALCLLLSVPAMAAGPVAENDKATVTVVEGSGASVAFDETNPEIIDITVSSNQLTAGEQYVVLMVKCPDGENYTINEDSILYIDQTAAVAGTPNASVSFSVYPSSLSDSVILITGAKDGLLKAAIVDGKYILGDVNDDGVVDIADVTQLLRYIVGLDSEDNINMDAANVDGSENVDVNDATKLLRVVVGLEQL